MAQHADDNRAHIRALELYDLQIDLLETLLDHVRHERLGASVPVTFELRDGERNMPLRNWQAQHLASPRYAGAGLSDRVVAIKAGDAGSPSEVFIFNPTDPATFAGWRAQGDDHVPLEPDGRGWLWSRSLELWLGQWMGEYKDRKATWLRLYHPQGYLVLTPDELAARHWRGVQARKHRGRHT
jgi:hypothetical protein